MDNDTKITLAEFIVNINTTVGHGLVEWAEELLGN